MFRITVLSFALAVSSGNKEQFMRLSSFVFIYLLELRCLLGSY